jgi:CheY-like chemotaxis protein
MNGSLHAVREVMKGLRHSLFLIEDSLDDEALSLRAITASGVPCEVQVSRHGGEALDLLLSPGGPTPDLIVLDFHLPGFNGLEILRELRKNEKTKHLPIVMLSGLGSDQDIADCLTEGASSCVEKPIDAQLYASHVGLIVRSWLTVDKRPEPN